MSIPQDRNSSHATVSYAVAISERATTYYHHLNWGIFQTLWGTLTWTYYNRSAGMPNFKDLGGTLPGGLGPLHSQITYTCSVR